MEDFRVNECTAPTWTSADLHEALADVWLMGGSHLLQAFDDQESDAFVRHVSRLKTPGAVGNHRRRDFGKVLFRSDCASQSRFCGFQRGW
ncbi:hypothetical protein BN2476_250181 [Paraburkholderia piptadeniae]|uniref:Uncharacterized protein n=1 Tax=Paraburkholderia piptadeniae TaxID=1701573 RepID=A0A1N7S108_9BURK|nr:hypothetical protein BN2476_250181 [Paraburkholderia piptadeniae]